MKNAMPNKKTQSGVFHYHYETAGRGPAIWGFLVLIPFLFILGGWAVLAPINAAAIAAGSVVLNQDRKIIQHLEGGIIDDILVEEGQVISAGAPIAVIRDIAQRTRVNTLYDQLASARALYARLQAERDHAGEPDFSALAENIVLPHDKLQGLRETQSRLFETRKRSLETKIELIRARKLATGKEIDGLGQQLKSIRTQLDLTRRESASIADLYQKNLVTTNRFMQMERDAAELEGQEGSLVANIARLEQTLASAEIEIIDLQTEARNNVLQELQTTELTLRELSHQLVEMADELERTIIRAPTGGIVMDMQFHTRGAVVRPGERILDLVPEDDRLIIEAQVNPNDIDLVKAGGAAKVLLTAYKAKKVPKLGGTVLNVSADILTEPASGQRYFLARVLVDDGELKRLTADVALYPGMQAQVFFLAGARSVADYIFSPFIDATYRAFREE